MVNNLPILSPEQRADVLAKAARSRQMKQAARNASTLRRDFADSPHWEELARVRGVRLPQWGDAPKPAGMVAFLKKCGSSAPSYLRWAGEHSLEDFAKANPTWPLRAWGGIVLEWLAP